MVSGSLSEDGILWLVIDILNPGSKETAMRKLLRRIGRPEARTQNSGELGMSKVDVPSGSRGGGRREKSIYSVVKCERIVLRHFRSCKTSTELPRSALAFCI